MAPVDTSALLTLSRQRLLDLGGRSLFSDEAAIALHATGLAPESAAFRAWRERTVAELDRASSKREPNQRACSSGGSRGRTTGRREDGKIGEAE